MNCGSIINLTVEQKELLSQMGTLSYKLKNTGFDCYFNSLIAVDNQAKCCDSPDYSYTRHIID